MIRTWLIYIASVNSKVKLQVRRVIAGGSGNPTLAECKTLALSHLKFFGKLSVLRARPESFFRPEGPAGAEPRPQGRSPGQGADLGPFYAPFAPKRVKFAQVTDPKTSRVAVLFHQGHRTHWGAMSYIGICRQERYMILKIAKITLATEQP